MILDIFNLYHIEHSIIVNLFRQYFDKIYCLVLLIILALILIMVESGHFIPLFDFVLSVSIERMYVNSFLQKMNG